MERARSCVEFVIIFLINCKLGKCREITCTAKTYYNEQSKTIKHFYKHSVFLRFEHIDFLIGKIKR